MKNNISPPIRPSKVFRGMSPTPSGSTKKPTPRRATPSMAFPPHPPRATTGSRQIGLKGSQAPVALRGAGESEADEPGDELIETTSEDVTAH
jgi:hypothetical protein